MEAQVAPPYSRQVLDGRPDYKGQTDAPPAAITAARKIASASNRWIGADNELPALNAHGAPFPSRTKVDRHVRQPCSPSAPSTFVLRCLGLYGEVRYRWYTQGGVGDFYSSSSFTRALKDGGLRPSALCEPAQWPNCVSAADRAPARQ